MRKSRKNSEEEGQQKDGSEESLVSRVRQGDEDAFEQLFFKYYYPLCRFAAKITRSNSLARDAVQEVFYKIWRSGEDWQVNYSLKVYLFQAVKNQSLNLVNKQKSLLRLKEQLQEDPSYNLTDDAADTKDGNSEELVAQVWRFVEKMPARRKLVFVLHRKHGLSYKEISRVMGISLKTVENHMGHALQSIRDHINITHQWHC